MKKIINFGAIALTLFSTLALAKTPAEDFLDNVVTDELHLAVGVASLANGEEIEISEHSRTSTVRSDREDSTVWLSFKSEEENYVVTFETDDADDQAIDVSVVYPKANFKSFWVKAKVSNSSATELSWNEKDENYFDTRESASSKRNLNQKKETIALTLIALASDTPAEVFSEKRNLVKAYRYEQGMLVDAAVFFDYRGISQLNPQGTQALVLMQAYHQED